mmetsp:Transcript_28257/g.45535  ORF Transcript_28257/g.45535 Transcript_28257/m.45535 type:complete len:277 (+) Transcript_28257:575-1405(+)|eukprot:CAMPEP_0203748314 /NCGR_PEP_ID=MMETSP0098-20131031/3237_1 /ASSEMBLY_ACC=CAM_ASM_000208 /TAXON_ID=96639 /ORGANISM=" , Strain NY0313808BC1" /LENGTH=276 /DNA_ID=CAMNT_0050637025 /DNA_START=515 /DNA_END=1345 /DNA_ORIENTATION=+
MSARVAKTSVKRWNVTKEGLVQTCHEVATAATLEKAEPQPVRIDARKSAVVIVDMQNDFCTKGHWTDHWAKSVAPGDISILRKPIEPIKKMLPHVRAAGMPVIWLNWGNRGDLANVPNNIFQKSEMFGNGVGLGACAKEGDDTTRILTKGSKGAAVVDELQAVMEEDDIHVDKFRISGFYGTQLDCVLRGQGIENVIFCGVNLDQCVLSTLQDASFAGYNCILLEDCCSTTSPDFCVQAALLNIKNIYGFVSTSTDLAKSLSNLTACMTQCKFQHS